MKKYINLVCFSALLTTYANAQSLSSSVIASGGSYHASSAGSLSFTIGETATQTLATSTNMLSQGFQQPEVDLKAGSIVIDTVCAGDVINIPFYATGIIGSNNEFIAQLSDASGSFASPVNIGSTVGNTSGSINAIIPLSTPAGNNYRIRLVSTLPVRTSALQPSFATQQCIVTLNLHLYIEGYYLGGGTMQSPLYNTGYTMDPTIVDSITVNLHEAVSPFNLTATDIVTIDMNGNAVATFPASVNGSTNYISIKGRSLIETWSKFPVVFGNITSFDFAQ